jgi:membrane associated rhomboid family serine protease
MTLVFGTATDALAANLGDSGAIAAVLARTLCYIPPHVLSRSCSCGRRGFGWFFLGFWFLYQLIEAKLLWVP